MKNKTQTKIQKRWNDAAMALHKHKVSGTPYYVLLSLSIECYLKSIRTKTYWSDGRGVGVMHEKGHDLLQLFSNLSSKHPRDALYLINQYQIRYKRDLRGDLTRNANVFTHQRYPYQADHSIPQPDRGFLYPKHTKEAKLDNHTYVDITALETVAAFLNEELTFSTNN